MKTFAALKSEVRALIWPNSEAENLVLAHSAMIEEALAEIQKWVECERDRNVNVYPSCSTLFRCGLTAFQKPDGIIRRVYTIANGDYCDPVFYRQKEWPEPEKYARALTNYESPLNVGYPKIPHGFQYFEATTDLDSVCGRARAGIWAIWSNRVFLYPWIQSNESVVVEWSGIKKTWSDDDQVNDDIDFRACVKLYVQYAHERDFGSAAESKRFKELYDAKLADLIHECRERTRKRSDLDYDELRSPLPAAVTDDAAPDPAEFVFAHIANYGNNNAVSRHIADLVRGWGPKFIIAGGGNTTAGDYDDDIGQFYHDFIHPYGGAYGDGSAINSFWPALGQADWDVAPGDLTAWKAFFKLPDEERYYELVRGDVHFFFISSSDDEPDGNAFNSTQGAWLQAKLALSTAIWKVVVLETPPYSSGATTGSTAVLQWPFESWGANMVVAGKAGMYERITVGGIPYLVNGAGGSSLETLGSLVAGSQETLNDEFGAIKFTVSSAMLKAEFWTRYGYLIDTVELTV
ncbi:MAG TPA: hypothetical protein VFU31_19240 [Candidatus Binatia bacterium]|nr:hypothetical protein [Candidatus Binatia bacterium]